MSAASSFVRPTQIRSLSHWDGMGVIKVRLDSKGSVRPYATVFESGHFICMVLLDMTGEIIAKAFNEHATMFYDLMEVGKMYYISNGRLQTVDRNYDNVSRHKYEIWFGDETVVTQCYDAEELEVVPTITNFNFARILDLKLLDEYTVRDVIGVCQDAYPLERFVAKNSGLYLTKREILLVDDSYAKVTS